MERRVGQSLNGVEKFRVAETYEGNPYADYWVVSTELRSSGWLKQNKYLHIIIGWGVSTELRSSGWLKQSGSG